MSTTNLFVELVIIGTGGACWLLLLVFSIIDYEWITKLDLKSLLAIPTIIPALTFIYVLGIVIDRFADFVYKGKTKSILKNSKLYKPDSIELYDDRRLILSNESPITKLYYYGRSRARICRGWSLNSFLIVVFLNVFLIRRITNEPLSCQLSLCGTLIFGVFSYACYRSWKALKESEYIKTKEQAKFLRTNLTSAHSEIKLLGSSISDSLVNAAKKITSQE